ncbi:MAG TPA: hypothetical protein VGC65_00360 [Bacteroidia bacterium]|jgi:hypothetical protein
MKTLDRNKIISEDFSKLPMEKDDKVLFWQCKHISNIVLTAPREVKEGENDIIIMNISNDIRSIKQAAIHGIKFTYRDESDLIQLLSSIAITQ